MSCLITMSQKELHRLEVVQRIRLISDGLSLFKICAETIYRYLPEARRKRRPRGARKPRDGVAHLQEGR